MCTCGPLCTLQVGDLVPVYVHKNPDFRLPPAPTTPIIMVGPGTGLAPFRAFIQHRLLEAGAAAAEGEAAESVGGKKAPKQAKASHKAGEMTLFFGCRRRDQDYLYGPQLEGWARAGALSLHTAFSREGGAKVYVQDRLRGAADAVWDALHAHGSHFYVCGDAGSMAGAVEEALLAVIRKRLPAAEAAALVAGAGAGGEADAARLYLDALSAAGRYQRDVWY